MPIYEYRCRECGAKFERLVRSFSATGIKCPQCGSEQTDKMVSAFAMTGGGAGDGGLGSSSGSSCGPGGFS